MTLLDIFAYLCTMITPDSIEQTHAFFHQKWRIYSQSTSATQRDDIEYAIAGYVEAMNPDLYALLAHGRPDYLLTHSTFAHDIAEAVDLLEARLP